MNFVLKHKGIQRHRFIRHVYGMYQRIALPVFVKTIHRALKYRITDMQTLERIAVLQLMEGHYQVPSAQIHQRFQNRESYIEGCFSDEVDLSDYDKMMEQDDG